MGYPTNCEELKSKAGARADGFATALNFNGLLKGAAAGRSAKWRALLTWVSQLGGCPTLAYGATAERMVSRIEYSGFQPDSFCQADPSTAQRN